MNFMPLLVVATLFGSVAWATAGEGSGQVLMIGGTYFLGKSIAAVLLREGYNLTFVTRGSDVKGIAQLEKMGAVHLRADRHDEKGMRWVIDQAPFWDAIVDMVAFDPETVEKFVQFFRQKGDYRFGLYAFISSTAAYLPCASDSGVHGKDPLTTETVEDDLRRDEDCNNEVPWQYAMNKWKIDKYLRDQREEDINLKRSQPLPFVTVAIPSMVGNYSRDDGRLDDRHYELQLLVERCNSIHLHEKFRPPRVYRHIAHDSHLSEAMAGMIRAGKKVHGEALNIIMQEKHTLEGYLEAIARALGSPMPLVEYSNTGWEGGSLFQNDPESGWGPLSIARAEQLIGYSPSPMASWMPELASWWSLVASDTLHSDKGFRSDMYGRRLKGACKGEWTWRTQSQTSANDDHDDHGNHGNYYYYDYYYNYYYYYSSHRQEI